MAEAVTSRERVKCLSGKVRAVVCQDVALGG